MSLLKRPDFSGRFSPFEGFTRPYQLHTAILPALYLRCRDDLWKHERRVVTLKQFGTDTADQRRNGESGKTGSESVTEQLARVIAHDLPQPLNAIVGFSDLLDRRYRGEIDEDADEFIGFIVTGARRMQRMLADLRTFLSVGNSPPPAAPVDCGKVVQAAVDSLATTIEDTGATVTVGPLPTRPGGLGPVRASSFASCSRTH